ncbi:TVP38/TMEM64 family protein [Deinococcus altitudinis]|uniref:TVP38/TMEM64 family protein n=1 Tax=Deinococcus altitudinis TaxID=468914 RepID=UPI0038927256
MPHFRSSSRLRRRIVRALVALAVLGLLVLAGLQPGTQSFAVSGYGALFARDPAVTHAWVTQFGAWGPLVLLAAFVVQAVLPVIPALILVLVSLLAYGPVTGFFIVYLGTLLGAAAGYGLGYGVGDPLIRALAGERHRDRAHAFATEQGLRGVLLIRLMPVLSSDLMNLVAGATRMPFGRFMAATALGALPVTLFITLLAHASAGSPARLGLGLALLSLVVGLAALTRWLFLRRARSRQVARSDQSALTTQPAHTVQPPHSGLPPSEQAFSPLELRPPELEKSAG